MPVRHFDSADLPAVLGLNQAALPAVNSHDPASLTTLLSQANRSWVAEEDGRIVGVLVSFAPGSAYKSSHYRWLHDRFDAFRYVDRVIIHPEYQRRGLGSQLYGSLEIHARASQATRLLCEVNLLPANPQSIAFHQRSGWTRVADRSIGPDKAVRYFEKGLDPSGDPDQ